MMQYKMFWGGEDVKNWKFQVQDKTQGVWTIYHKQINPNIETLAAANVSIFGITLVAAANVSKYGNISSCYHPQPWELRPAIEVLQVDDFRQSGLASSDEKRGHGIQNAERTSVVPK